MSDPVEPASDSEKAVEAMNVLHAEIGKKAAELALKVLDAIKPEDIPVPAAVSLLKFGVELERKALLGVEEDGPAADPFDKLSQLAGAIQTPKEG